MIIERFYSRRYLGDMRLPVQSPAELRKADPALVKHFRSSTKHRQRFLALVNRELRKKNLVIDPTKIINLRVGIDGNHFITVITPDELRSGKFSGGYHFPNEYLLTEAAVVPVIDGSAVIGFLIADCAPITGVGMKKDKSAMAFAGHGSWRNLILRDMIKRIVGTLRKAGINPEDIEVEIGPTICQKHYEVGSEVIGPLRHRFPAIAKKVLKPTRRAGFKLFDIPRFIQLQFKTLGVGKVHWTGECTRKHGYFSHRLNKTKKRFLALMITRKEESDARDSIPR